MGTHWQVPEIISQVPSLSGASQPKATQGGTITHGPPQLPPVHAGVGVGPGVKPIGTHPQSPAALDSHCPATRRSGHGTPGAHGNGMLHGPPHGTPVHWGVGVGPGVGSIGTHSHVPDVLISHCPANAGTSGPLHVPEAVHGRGTNTVHGPPHVAPVHCGVGVGPGVGSIGTQAHAPAALNSHCPTATGQVSPSGHSVGITHVPPQGTPLHWGVGVGVGGPGVCVGGETHSHLPASVTSHWPSCTGTSGPCELPHRTPGGHGGGGNGMTQKPAQGTPAHCGVGVGVGGPGVCVGGGTHSHLPEFTSHCPTATGQVAPSGHSVRSTHVPPQGTLLHCGVGGHCRVQI
jgi:hypothetical protein